MYDGRLDQAREDYEKAIEFKSDYHQAYNNLGYVYRQKGKIEQAFNKYNELITADRRN